MKCIKGRNRNSSPIFSIFSIPGGTQLTLTLIFKGINWYFFVLLQKCYCALAQSAWKSKRHLVNKNLSFVTPGIEYCHSQKPEKNLKRKIVYDYKVGWLN